jgi:hypothetical protein
VQDQSGVIYIVAHVDVKKWIHRECEKFAHHLESISPSRHNIEIQLCPAPFVTTGDGRYGFGVFGICDGWPIIALACDWLPWRKRGIENRKDAIHMILSNFAHEWHHYEQFRDGKAGTHRGTDRRTEMLLRGYF